MNLADTYVSEVLHQIRSEHRESPHDMTRWRREWGQGSPAPRRVFVAWVGDRLVDLGKRLKEWSVAARRPALPE